MESLTSSKKLFKNYIKKHKLKNNIVEAQDDNSNYINYTTDNYIYLKKEENQKEYNNYEKIYMEKKNIFNYITTNEAELENKYIKINDSFCDKKNDRDSLVLQIVGAESIN